MKIELSYSLWYDCLMGSSLRDKAIRLRTQGWSYNVISDRLHVNKSTLSGWLKHAPYKPNQAVIDRIKAGPRISGELRRQKKIADIAKIHDRAQQDVGEFTSRDLMMIGIGLYIGEGAKQNEQTRFANSDPKVIQIIMHWFRNVCQVPNEHFRATVHIHPDIRIEKALTYWSKITQLPKSQFLATQVDRRTSKRIKIGRLPYGTAHITVNACGKKEFGTALHRKITGWIEAVNKTTRSTNAGVV